MPPNRFRTARSSAATSLDAADVDRRRHDVGGAARRDRRQFCCGLGEPIGAEIGDTDLHAEAGEPHRGGKADAGRASGDDGNIIGRHGWVGHGGFSGSVDGNQPIELCRSRCVYTMHETAWEVFVRAPPAQPALRCPAAAVGFGYNDPDTVRTTTSIDTSRECRHGCDAGNSDHTPSLCGWFLQEDADRRQMGRRRLRQAIRDPQSRHRRIARHRRRGRCRGHQPRSCGRPPRLRGAVEQGQAVRAAEPAAQARRSRREEFRGAFAARHARHGRADQPHPRQQAARARHAALLRGAGDRAAWRDHRELAARRDLLLHAEGAGRRGRRDHSRGTARSPPASGRSARRSPPAAP